MLRKRIAQDLLFYVFDDDRLVAAATGFTKGRSGVLSEQVSPVLPEDFMDGDHIWSLDEAEGVLAVYQLLCESSDATLNAKLFKIEMTPSNQEDLRHGFSPYVCDDYDLKGWAQLSIWTAEQAALISVGLAPTRRALDILETLPAVTSLDCRLIREIRDRVESLGQAMRAGQLSEPGQPTAILELLQRFEFGMPDQLIDFVRRFHHILSAGVIKDSERIIPSTEADTPNEDLDLDPRRKSTYLKLIAAMAAEQYAHNPQNSKNSSISNIQNDLDTVGLSLDQKTIRSVLDEATVLIPEQYWPAS